MSAARRVLCAALLALAVLYATWFGYAGKWVALALFALPPLWLLRAVMQGHRGAGLWSGLWALAWFSHGVMVAWTRPPERGLALTEIALAITVVFAASLPGLRARFNGRD